MPKNSARLSPTATSEAPCPAHQEAISSCPPPCGLINAGNTCYLNATLQCIGACPPCSRASSGPLSFATHAAWQHLLGQGPLPSRPASSQRRAPYNPCALLAALGAVAPQFKSRQQHDAHEALHALLDGLK
ncbi:hypothetical protein V8C86DRAFT_3025389, partial [Haematococcus lacustris]